MRFRETAVIAAATTTLTLLGYGEVTRNQASSPKLGYINSQAVLEEAPGAQEAQSAFEREMARWRSEVQTLSDSLQQMIQQYEQQQVMLSPEKRQERQQEIQQKRLEYNQRVTELQDRAQERQQELVQPVYDKISRVLADIRDQDDYTMIFDAAAGGLIAADTTLDLTDRVIERLKQQDQQEQASNPGDAN